MLREILHKALSNTENCLGVLIMGTDGIAVEEIWKDDAKPINADIIFAEYTALLRSAVRVGDGLLFDRVRELTISGDESVFIMRLVSPDYYLAMALRTDGNFGRGRYELRCAEMLLAKELAF
jgi:predicted regulator of Ras-like GTPase activity (Roadblock/LC7/MglB family)